MKRILIITTGGTIAMKKDKEGNLVPAVSGEELLNAVPGLENEADITVMEFSNIPSEYMTPEKMLELSRFLKEKDREINPDGIVITHGTDTMEETAFFLDHTCSLEKPVVLTGAMRGASAAGADGPANILAAVKTAGDSRFASMGVLVVMNDRVFMAHDVEKTHSTATDTFASNNLGPVGMVYGSHIDMRIISHTKNLIIPDSINKNVWIWKCGAGMDGSFGRAAIGAGADGILVEGFGCGNVPLGVADGINELLFHKIPVVLVSRTWSGSIEKEYGGEGGTAALLEKGVISGGNLSGQKARILLLLALSAGKTGAELREVFAREG